MPLIWTIGLLVASAALSALAGLLQKKPAPPKPAGIGDFQIPQIDENTPQGVFFGDCWTGGWQVLWYGDLRTTGIKPPGGKKGK